MRQRRRFHQDHKEPYILLSPMIDLIFLLLVTFIAGTMYMENVHTMPVRLPAAAHSVRTSGTPFMVTLTRDGKLFLDDREISQEALVQAAARKSAENASFSVVIRADKDVSYDRVMSLLDVLKGAGVTRFGLASGEKP